MSRQATSAPPRARPRAVARPMPRGRAAPVTSATLPANGRSAGIVCETHRANVATNAGGRAVRGGGAAMRAAVTRGGQLVVGDVPDPVPSSGHVVVRSLAAGICGSDLHALADFSPLHRAHGLGRRARAGPGGRLRVRPRVLRRDRRARARHRRHPARSGPGSAPCPSSWAPPASSRSATPTPTRARWPSTWCSRSCCCSRCPTRWRPTWPR